MNEGRTVFAQLLDFLPKYEFDKCVARYHGNFRVRKPRPVGRVRGRSSHKENSQFSDETVA